MFWMHCILYADDKFCYLSLNSLPAMRAKLDICEKFAVDSDVKFNSLKLTVARIGEHISVKCAPLIFDGPDLQ